jgi:hypothetical protein
VHGLWNRPDRRLPRAQPKVGRSARVGFGPSTDGNGHSTMIAPLALSMRRAVAARVPLRA